MYIPWIDYLPHVVAKEGKATNSSTGPGPQTPQCSLFSVHFFCFFLHLLYLPVMILVNFVQDVNSRLLTKDSASSTI